MLKFETGKTYFTRSTCDHDCIFKFKIERRTAKSVWIKDDHTGEIVRKSISIWYDGSKESFKPHGSYSMAAIICADKEWQA